VSPKVNDGLSWSQVENQLLSKRPLPIGGWFCKNLEDVFTNTGWGWSNHHDKEYGGAALVAPLSILFWEKE